MTEKIVVPPSFHHHLLLVGDFVHGTTKPCHPPPCHLHVGIVVSTCAGFVTTLIGHPLDSIKTHKKIHCMVVAIGAYQQHSIPLEWYHTIRYGMVVIGKDVYSGGCMVWYHTIPGMYCMVPMYHLDDRRTVEESLKKKIRGIVHLITVL